jgi:hypothetical protein
MEIKKLFLVGFVSIFGFWSTFSVAVEKAPMISVIPMTNLQVNPQPPIKMLQPGIFEIGGCTIIKEQNRVEFPATVNMQEGLLEYLLVSSAGKLHESLLQTKIEPYALQIALLLTGLEGGGANPLVRQGQPDKPEGDLINIWLSWAENGQEKKIRVEQCILADNKVVDEIPWVFTGSVINDGVFMAQVEKSIIAVYHDPTALIDHQLKSGASDEVWLVDSTKVPEVGTSVQVIIEKK